MKSLVIVTIFVALNLAHAKAPTQYSEVIRQQRENSTRLLVIQQEIRNHQGRADTRLSAPRDPLVNRGTSGTSNRFGLNSHVDKMRDTKIIQLQKEQEALLARNNELLRIKTNLEKLELLDLPDYDEAVKSKTGTQVYLSNLEKRLRALEEEMDELSKGMHDHSDPSAEAKQMEYNLKLNQYKYLNSLHEDAAQVGVNKFSLSKSSFRPKLMYSVGTGVLPESDYLSLTATRRQVVSSATERASLHAGRLGAIAAVAGIIGQGMNSAPASAEIDN